MAPLHSHPKLKIRHTSEHWPPHTFFHTASTGGKKAAATAPKAKPAPPASTTKGHSSAVPHQAKLPQQASTNHLVPPQQPFDFAQPRSPPSSTHASAPKTSHLSPSALNAFAVSTLSAQAHPSRPAPKINDGSLPKNYKAAARRITLAMVAAPIAIVTSWVLWERLVMGQERKRLVREPVEEVGVKRV
ncbi:hypothetical protein MMC27_008253 [Xylographa pallens]|nr:hypothetical protein [Xylographa pallens]